MQSRKRKFGPYFRVPNLGCYKGVDDDDESFHKKGLMILKALPKNKNAHAIHFEIMETPIERGLIIKALEASLEEKGKIERDDAIEKASLEDALEEEQETRASLEEKLESIEESHNEIITKIVSRMD